jgi:phosphopantetheinyl transferase
VRKEAVVKCTGEGLQRDLRSFLVDASAPSAEVVAPDRTPMGLRTHAVRYAGHVAALAVAGAGPGPRSGSAAGAAGR